MMGQPVLQDLDIERSCRILDEELEYREQTVLRRQHTVEIGDVLQFEQRKCRNVYLSLNVKCKTWVPSADRGLNVGFAREVGHHEIDLGRKPATGRRHWTNGLSVIERGTPQGNRLRIIICRTSSELISQHGYGLEFVAREERVESGEILVHPVIDGRLIKAPRERSPENIIDDLVSASGCVKLGGAFAQLTLQRFCLMPKMFLCLLHACLVE